MTRGRSPLQRSGALVADDNHGDVTMTLRLPPGSGLTFANGATEVSTTQTLTKGEHRTLLVDWRLVAAGALRPAHVLLEVDVRGAGDAANHGTVLIRFTWSAVSSAMMLAGISAIVVGAAIMATRRRRGDETRRGSAASRSEPRMDAPDSSAAPESGRDRSTPKSR
jgi:hypothetical protein